MWDSNVFRPLSPSTAQPITHLALHIELERSVQFLTKVIHTEFTDDQSDVPVRRARAYAL